VNQAKLGDQPAAPSPAQEAADSQNDTDKARDCPRCPEPETGIADPDAAARDRDSTSGASVAGGAELPSLEFRALRITSDGWGEGWQLRPSPAGRYWMDQSKHAYHCLPLVIANQWGWQILCPTDVAVTWDGNPNLHGLRVDVAPPYQSVIQSQFGWGIVTFSPPWLFRTSAGWDLYVKGPSNRWKANCAALDGVIETWWLNHPFTLNWKVIEPGTVFFARGESLAQLVPVPHATFENSGASEAPIGLLEPKAEQDMRAWQEKRQEVAGQKLNVHLLYRKAEGIEEHLHRVNVPAIRPIEP
jgi:Family of unknown function (DUF6065)